MIILGQKVRSQCEIAFYWSNSPSGRCEWGAALCQDGLICTWRSWWVWVEEDSVTQTVVQSFCFLCVGFISSSCNRVADTSVFYTHSHSSAACLSQWFLDCRVWNRALKWGGGGRDVCPRHFTLQATITCHVTADCVCVSGHTKANPDKSREGFDPWCNKLPLTAEGCFVPLCATLNESVAASFEFHHRSFYFGAFVKAHMIVTAWNDWMGLLEERGSQRRWIDLWIALESSWAYL